MENTQTADIAVHTGIAGQYSAQVIHADGSVTEVPWFENMILDSGLDDMGTQNGPLRARCHVGTGTSTPVAGQVALDSRIASVIHTNYFSGNGYPAVNVGAPTYASEHTTSYTFGIGAVVGNITEVGVSADQYTTGARLFSRSLFKDGGGNPIAVTVTATDQLVVYHKVIFTPVSSDYTGTVSISGTPYGYTIRRYNIAVVAGVSAHQSTVDAVIPNALTAFGGTVSLNPITSTSGLTGTNLGTGANSTLAAYIPGTFTRGVAFVFPPPIANHVGGVMGFHLGSVIHSQIVLDAPIMKTNLQQLTLNFQMSWGR